jgi:pyrroline-5-carboxylate reductase
LHERYGVTSVASASQLSFPFDVVVLAVKPQVMMGVLDELSTAWELFVQQHNLQVAQGTCKNSPHLPLFVSLAAGLSTQRLEQALPEGAHVVRTMPNTPLLVGQGATGVCAGSLATQEDLACVTGLFGCLGQAFVVEESKMDAICALSGSGPAYVAALIEAVSSAGAELGLEPEFAEQLFLQTVLGTAQLMRETGQSAEATRLAVCSPKGTTLAALEAFEGAGFAQACREGVLAAARRSKELQAC